MSVQAYFDAVQSDFHKRLEPFIEADDAGTPPPAPSSSGMGYDPFYDPDYRKRYRAALVEAERAPLASRVMKRIDEVNAAYSDFLYDIQTSDDDQVLIEAGVMLQDALVRMSLVAETDLKEGPMQTAAGRNPERDAFIIEQRQEGKTHKQILAAIKEHPEWEQLDSPQAINGVLKRRNGKRS